MTATDRAVVHATAHAVTITGTAPPDRYFARFCEGLVREPEKHLWADVTCPKCLAKRDAVTSGLERRAREERKL
jgi:hypothetical protein